MVLPSGRCRSRDSSAVGDPINFHPSLSRSSSSEPTVKDALSSSSSLLPVSMTPNIGKSFDALVRSMISVKGDESEEELLTGGNPRFVEKLP